VNSPRIDAGIQEVISDEFFMGETMFKENMELKYSHIGDTILGR
jgi:hypothetical protein